MKYVALVDGKKGAYGVVVPDLPGCTSAGKTILRAGGRAALGHGDPVTPMARAHPLPPIRRGPKIYIGPKNPEADVFSGPFARRFFRPFAGRFFGQIFTSLSAVASPA